MILRAHQQIKTYTKKTPKNNQTLLKSELQQTQKFFYKNINNDGQEGEFTEGIPNETNIVAHWQEVATDETDNCPLGKGVPMFATAEKALSWINFYLILEGRGTWNRAYKDDCNGLVSS